MKNVLLSIITVGILLFISCKKNELIFSTIDSTKIDTLKIDTVKVDTIKYKFKIGEGVEIYKAKFKWGYSGMKAFVIDTQIIGTKPIVRYDEINGYSYEPKTKATYFLFSKPTINFIPKKGYIPLVVDTGYVVTVNKKGIFTTFVFYEGSGPDDKGVHLLWYTSSSYTNYFTFPDNSIILSWDSTIHNYDRPPTPRNLPDPRFQKSMLERLKQDGKLNF